jgi:DNA polymerase V
LIDYSTLPRHNIICVDMKSFYASCAAVDRGLDPLTCHLAVVADQERPGAVVLAASPALKKDYGIKTGSRLFEIPKDQHIQIVDASMGRFLDTSAAITELFYQFVPWENIHTYSVDESFLQLDGTERLWGSVEEAAAKIQAAILDRFGLPSAIGIGDNMLLAKLCLDLSAKKKPGGIGRWTYEDVPENLWPVRLSDMWGIGSRMERNLNRQGIRTVGDLAKYPLDLLKKKYGVMGEQLYWHANGVDLSGLGEPDYIQRQISYGKSQILMRDYEDVIEVKRVILEMCEEVARRARSAGKAGRTVSLGVGYSQLVGGGFHRSVTIQRATNITTQLYHACIGLFDKFYAGVTVRSLSVTLSNVEEDTSVQMDLFEPNLEKKRALGYTMDYIRKRHGATALLRAVSYAPGGTAMQRAGLLGGHKA